jgi:hypothetical protein
MEQTKSFVIGHRLAGTRQEYWTLKLVLNGEVVNVHTSKSKNYILNLANNWNNR